jgi:hypothetical protein
MVERRQREGPRIPLSWLISGKDGSGPTDALSLSVMMISFVNGVNRRIAEEVNEQNFRSIRSNVKFDQRIWAI